MAAGPMRERITFRRRTEVADGAGGVVRSWADLPDTPTVWAKVEFKAAREGLSEGRVNASQVTVFEVYNRADVNETDAILWRGEVYNIRALRRYGHGPLKMWLDAERGVAE